MFTTTQNQAFDTLTFIRVYSWFTSLVFEGFNGKNRRHFIGDKTFFRLAKRIKSLRHVGASN